jgi:oligopeptide/dipeptide ABC transporter ATP-binding protein
VNETALIRLTGISKTFHVGQRTLVQPRARLHALSDVDLEIAPGETLGIVGESGCGKSTLARVIVGLTQPDEGTIAFAGRDISGMRRRPADIVRSLQMVFQDPYSALNPRMSVGDAIIEPLLFHGIVPRGEAAEERDRLMDLVGLSPTLARRYPHELSGGQRQRVNIARALSVRPQVLVADEAVASLDVSVRAQILNLFSDLRDQLGLTLLFISHDLSVVDHLCDRVAVMYLGRIVEQGPSSILRMGAAHHYTHGLASAIPQPVPGTERTQPAIRGELPSPIHPPSGCGFRTRCPQARPRCAEVTPPLVPFAPGHLAACHYQRTRAETATQLMPASAPS